MTSPCRFAGGYEGLCVALPPEHWAARGSIDLRALAARLPSLASNIDPDA